ncbi:hypothetical protein BD289DRAFT_71989 [Coniella lustricola]|uniref:Uncharacterized protein n=1 Tax=Coniella lustricola TaxID=2025994 RepID=A0A2T2ZZR8_9PEZI|nr:hypothetical protein BD289DRAFT_71989 [Coniella lustricola]
MHPGKAGKAQRQETDAKCIGGRLAASFRCGFFWLLGCQGGVCLHCSAANVHCRPLQNTGWSNPNPAPFAVMLNQGRCLGPPKASFTWYALARHSTAQHSTASPELGMPVIHLVISHQPSLQLRSRVMHLDRTWSCQVLASSVVDVAVLWILCHGPPISLSMSDFAQVPPLSISMDCLTSCVHPRHHPRKESKRRTLAPSMSDGPGPKSTPPPAPPPPLDSSSSASCRLLLMLPTAAHHEDATSGAPHETYSRHVAFLFFLLSFFLFPSLILACCFFRQ